MLDPTRDERAGISPVRSRMNGYMAQRASKVTTSDSLNRDGLWTHWGEKFSIGTIHGDLVEIVAQYNPKELARQAAAQWSPHPNTSARHSKIGENYCWLEYGTTDPRTMTVELLFDGFEESVSVSPIVKSLEALTIPVDMTSRDSSKRRPQLCIAVWGEEKMRCVVTAVSTKFTMFDARGRPVRATCTVTLKEVDAVAVLESEQRSGRRSST